MSQEPTIIYRGWRLQEAYLLRNLLIEQGVPAVVFNENVQPLWGAVPMTPETGPQVAVPSEFAEQARVVAHEFDAAQQRLSLMEEPPPTAAHESEPLPAWPICPACGAARLAKCPDCGEIGEGFRLADEAPRSADLPPDLPDARALKPVVASHLCGTCDEPITPLLARRCPNCGHDFGAGAEIERNPAADHKTRPFNYRVLAVFIAVVATIAGMAYYVTNLTPKKAPDAPRRAPLPAKKTTRAEDESAKNVASPAEVKTFLEKVIDAHGGKSAIVVSTAEVILKGSGEFGPGIDGEFEMHDTWKYPDKLKRLCNIKNSGKSMRLEMFFHDGLGRLSMNGKISPIPGKEEFMPPMPLDALQTISTLSEAGVDCQLSKETSPRGEILDVFKVSNGGKTDSICIDRETHRFVKTVKDWIPQFGTDNRTTTVTTFGAYKTFGALTIPTNITVSQGGRKVLEVEVLKYNANEEIDDSTFDFPME